ncbi:MAG: PhaM family polyhydroxyalkanoate granule multifunctional regulatory protein [Burkholderiales bacterium]
MSSNPGDPFEFLKKLWAPMGLPMSGMGTPGMMFPSVDIGEIERRISDMRSVETWLALNLEIVRTTIKGLEAQRATVQAIHTMHQGATAAANAAASAAKEASADQPKAPAAPPPDHAAPRPKRGRKAT